MDHYDILGVGRDASADDIRAAYQRRIRDAHPDRGGNVQDAAAINAAYACLSDPERRASYDEHGEELTPRAQTIYQSAIESLVSMLEAAIEQDDPILPRIKAHVVQLRDEFTKSAPGLQKRVDSLAERRKLFEGGDEREPNLVVGVINARIGRLERELATLATKVEIAEECLRIVSSMTSREVERIKPPSTMKALDDLVIRTFLRGAATTRW